MTTEEISKQAVAAFNLIHRAIPEFGFTATVCLEEETIISCGRFTMEPAVYVARTIGGTKEVPGWSVLEWQDIPATRENPPDISDALVGCYPTYQDAVKVFIDCLLKEKARVFWEKIADEEFARQLEEEERMFADHTYAC